MPAWAELPFHTKLTTREPRCVCVELSVERVRQVPRESRLAPKHPDEGDAYGYAFKLAFALRELAMAFVFKNTPATPASGLPAAIEEIRTYAPEVPILWETPHPQRHPEILPLVDAVIVNPYLGAGYHQELFHHKHLGILGCCRDSLGSDEFQTHPVLQRDRYEEGGKWHTRTQEVPFFQHMAQTIGVKWNKDHFNCSVYARTGDIEEIAAIRSVIKDLPLFVEPPHGTSEEDIAKIAERCVDSRGGYLYPILSSKFFSFSDRECSIDDAKSMLRSWSKAMQMAATPVPTKIAA